MRNVRVILSPKAEEVYKKLNVDSPMNKQARMILKAVNNKIELIKLNIHYGDPIAKNLIPEEYKQKIKNKLEAHLEWLRPLDHLNRATVGFESAINFMMSTDNTHLIDTFWRKTHELDAIRNENILDIIPELKALK